MKLTYIEPIGAGAFAEVWLATDVELDRPVAVKFFRDTDPDVHRQVALNHARALARVQHPRVVTIFGIEPQKHPQSGKDCIAIIMEHVSGTPLHLHREQFSTSQACTILSDMAAALDAIHAAGLIHDDFHEGNVMVTPGGAKVLDIFYTRSLADVGSRTAQGDRMSDIRSYANVARFVLEHTSAIDVTAIHDSHFHACHSTTAVEACRAFASIFNLHSSNFSTSTQEAPIPKAAALHRERPYDGADLYLLWVPMGGTSCPVTQVYGPREGTLTHVGTLKHAYHATATQLWKIRTQSRPIRLLKDDVLERWYQEDLTHAPTDTDYQLHKINDADVVRIGDLVSIPLSSSDPEPLMALDCFEYDRSLYVLGALGPYLFIEEHDYSFGGGAHGGMGCRHRIIDLSDIRIVDSVEKLFDTEELTKLRRHDALARQSFVSFRADEIMTSDEIEVKLVSARPYLDFGAEGAVGLILKYCTSACYALSDHRWSSYSVSEEVPLRGLPQLLAPYTKVPDSLLTALSGGAVRATAWSCLAPEHPQRDEILEALETSNEDVKKRS